MRGAGAFAAGIGAFVGFIGGTILGATIARRERTREGQGGTILFAQAIGAVTGAAIGGSIGAETATERALTPPTTTPPVPAS